MHQEQKTINSKYLTLKKNKNINNNVQQIKSSSKVKKMNLQTIRKE